jgi:polyhydroxyalkanoate synthesis regulator phasin
MAWMGKSLYAKIEILIAEIRAIMLSDVMNKKDIETLKEKVEQHEERISSLENKHI